MAEIMVVDDEPRILALLSGILERTGYVTHIFKGGEEALEGVRDFTPDLILMDVCMPGMDGYAVCRALKSEPKLQEVPVIFISGLSDPVDKVKAFNAGGVDFINKPFDFDEMLARIKTHLSLWEMKHALQVSYANLRELEKQRDSLTNMVVHDLKSPIVGMMVNVDDVLASAALEDNARRQLQQALDNGNNLMNMISALLDVSRMEDKKMPLSPQSCRLDVLIDEAIARLGGLAHGRDIVKVIRASNCTVLCDPNIIRRVMENLLNNALNYTSNAGEVSVVVDSTQRGVRIEVRDRGEGIPIEYQQMIFNKFGQVEARSQRRKYSTGLGLTFCKMAVEAHGGHIGVNSTEGEGSTFWFTLPGKE